MIRAAAFLAALAAGQAAAQARQNCAPRDRVIAFLAERYGEGLQAMGLSGSAVMELYANRATGTWTLVATGPEGIACLVASGQAFEPHGEVAKMGVPG